MMEQTQTKSSPKSSASATHGHLLQRKCACGGTPSVSGECEECHKKRVGIVQGQVTNVAESPAVAPPIVHDVLHSPGQPLDAGTRAFFEPCFGHDFSQVRVHTDSLASKSSQAINALAYTVGRDIVFGAGQYAPHTKDGNRLLSHELTHVVQQQNCSPRKGEPILIGPAYDEHEAAAERNEFGAASGFGSAGRSASRLSRALIQRRCPDTPTGIGRRPPRYSCEHGAEGTGQMLYFCQDSDVLLDGSVGYFPTILRTARRATSITLHGHSSVDGPSSDYNFNLSCLRAGTISDRLRASGVGVPIRLVSHGPVTRYGGAPLNRNVVVDMEVPQVAPPRSHTDPRQEALRISRADERRIDGLYRSQRLLSRGLFLRIYRCLTRSFTAAIQSGQFHDPLWLAHVNHFAINRLVSNFASPNARYQRAFSSCLLLDQCLTGHPGFFGSLTCAQITRGTGTLSYIQMCTEDVGATHLRDLSDALRAMGCSSPQNREDYAHVVPLFEECNRRILSQSIPLVGGIVANHLAIPQIIRERDQAWTDAGCPTH